MAFKFNRGRSAANNRRSRGTSARTGRMPNFRQRQRFPESNVPSRQIQLLLLGSMPRVKQTFRALLYRLGEPLTNLSARLHSPVERRKWAFAAVFLLLCVSVVPYAVFKTLYTTATTVSFDGVELGIVASEEEAQAARVSVEQSISQVVGYHYSLDDRVSYTTGLAFRTEVEDGSTLERAISNSIHVVEHGYALYVDGHFIGATQTREALDEALVQVSLAYRNENTVSIDFVEGVEIRECDLPVESFTNLSDILLVLNSTKEGEVTYTVKAGDCWSVIAQDHNLTIKELSALNPGYDIDWIHVGDVLLISNAVPYLTVRATQMEYYVAEIPYEIEYVDDDTMWQGDTKVLTKGVYGTKDVVARVTYEGVDEVERIIESETILTEPQTEVQARGTKERPSWLPTGTFRWPTNGTFTSGYGYRYIFGATSFHGGVDIANVVGTDVVAADGGEVIYAGWMSGYGYLVEIDHFNGYVTYYAHNSSLLVSVGDKVYKGQHIAEMGATGQVTGPHCHFEVRYNGERKNPMNYLP